MPSKQSHPLPQRARKGTILFPIKCNVTSAIGSRNPSKTGNLFPIRITGQDETIFQTKEKPSKI